MGRSTACMYCSVTTTAMLVSTVSVRLVTPTGALTTTGAGSPGAPGVGDSGVGASSMPSWDGRAGSDIGDDCTLGVRGSRIEARLTVTLVSDFDFALPDELVAQRAVARGASRLLVLQRSTGALEHATVRDFPRFLRGGDLLVANDTRVFPARLLGRRVPSGGSVECLLLARPEPILNPRFSTLPPLPRNGDGRASEIWSALVHPGPKLKPGALVRFAGPAGVLTAAMLERRFFGRLHIPLCSESRQDGDPPVHA